MKRPKVSIGWVMAIVELVAVDLSYLRWLVEKPGEFLLQEFLAAALTLPAMLNVLTVIGLMLIRDLWRRGESEAFGTGFFVCGCGAMLVVTAITANFLESILESLRPLLQQLFDPMDGRFVNENALAAIAIILSLAFIPQIVVALIGGWLNRRFVGFVIVRRIERAGRVEDALTGGSEPIGNVHLEPPSGL